MRAIVLAVLLMAAAGTVEAKKSVAMPCWTPIKGTWTKCPAGACWKVVSGAGVPCRPPSRRKLEKCPASTHLATLTIAAGTATGCSDGKLFVGTISVRTSAGRMEGEVVNGQMHGVWTVYGSGGTALTYPLFDHGQLISEDSRAGGDDDPGLGPDD